MAGSTFCGSSDGETVSRSSIVTSSGALLLVARPSARRAHPRFDQFDYPLPELVGSGVFVGDALVCQGDRVPDPDGDFPLVPVVEAGPAGRRIAPSPLREEPEPPVPRGVDCQQL